MQIKVSEMLNFGSFGRRRRRTSALKERVLVLTSTSRDLIEQAQKLFEEAKVLPEPDRAAQVHRAEDLLDQAKDIANIAGSLADGALVQIAKS